jgi:hypothetical protein
MRHVAAAAILALLAVPAGAQVTQSNQRPRTPIDRIFVSIDGVYQTGGEDFTDRKTFVDNAEDGNFATNYSVESGPALNVSAGVHLTQRLAVGVGVSRYSHSTPTSLTASVPHPFFFDRDRALASEIGGLSRKELAVHIQARFVIPVSSRLRAMVFGGPSFFQVKQDIVNDFTYTDSYPFDTASFTSGVTSSVSESTLGFNVGGDLSYFFTPQLGVGATVQLVGADVEMPSAGTGTIDASAGKFQAGAGLRLRF